MRRWTASSSAAPKLDVGFFAQHQVDDLDEEATPYQCVAELMRGEPEAKIRGRCAQLGFPNVKADTKIALLSGGEKARLLMGLASFNGPHLLILDEPTNHLDIDSRAALIEAINEYRGAVILVSHDRYLLDACADRLWVVGDGRVASFDGTWTIISASCCRRAATRRREAKAKPDESPGDACSAAPGKGGAAQEARRRGRRENRQVSGPTCPRR